MNYADCLCRVIGHLQDWDLPANLLPLTVCQEAALHSGLESDRIGFPDWH